MLETKLVGIPPIYRLERYKELASGMHERERQNVHPWGVWDSDRKSYEYTFRDVFKDSLPLFLRRRRFAGRGAYVADVMGAGGVLRTLPIDGGLAVTLGDGRSEEQKCEDTESNIKLLEGNVIEKNTWRAVETYLNQKDRPGFDLMLVRPVAGLDYIPQDARLGFTLMSKMWENLNPDGGVLLTQTMRRYNSDIQRWVPQLKKAKILARFSEGALMLEKNPLSDVKLPAPEI